MKKKALKLIFNPGAGNGDKDAAARLGQAILLLTGLGFQVHTVLSPRKEATAAARRAVKDGYRLVVVMGGDGTIEAVARGLLGSKARLGILPGGTYNNVAKSLGIPEDLEGACRLLKDAPKRRMDVGRVQRGKRKMHFFEQVGVGLNAAVFPELQDVHKLNLDRITSAVKTLINFPVPHFTLTLDGKDRVEADTLLVTIANTPAYGPVFLEAPQAALDDGLLEISMYPGFSKTELAAYFASIMNGKPQADPRVLRYRARRVTLTADPAQDSVADNFVLGSGKVKVSVQRKALRVFAPREGGLAQDGQPPHPESVPVESPAEDKYRKDPAGPVISIPATGEKKEA